jgi:hypothetical protein
MFRWKSNKYCIFWMCSVAVAWIVQHAKLMLHLIPSSVAYLAVQYFSTLSHKRHDFQKKNFPNVKCVFIFSTIWAWNIYYFKNIQRDIITNVNTFWCKVPVLLVSILWNLHFLHRFSKNNEISNFVKNPSVGRRFVPYGIKDDQTGRRYAVDSVFSSVCECE